ncbi:unnamed protein product [Phytomonas sp. EM1]|nr:unnamed protein product [Phytomonas sp. EM1]|eukprot:CCW61157.1 unnamed protein product [Phytomonas sp. isolate EM1]
MKFRYARHALEKLCEQKFTRLCSITYKASSDEKNLKKWEMVQRTTRDLSFEAFKRTPVPISCDSVDICAVLNRHDQKYLILVAQYRAPLDSIVLEFPAGLIDKNETPTQAALRELFEETGYTAVESDIVHVSPAICLDPGLSDTCCCFIRIEVDGTRLDNISPKQHLDEGEDIDVILLPITDAKNILNSINELINEKRTTYGNMILDGRLYSFLEALSHPII